jgi:hypothetical protein
MELSLSIECPVPTKSGAGCKANPAHSWGDLHVCGAHHPDSNHFKIYPRRREQLIEQLSRIAGAWGVYAPSPADVESVAELEPCIFTSHRTPDMKPRLCRTRADRQFKGLPVCHRHDPNGELLRHKPERRRVFIERLTQLATGLRSAV